MNNLKKNLDEAKKLHQNGDLVSAINIYLKIINAEKNNPEVNFYLGTAYLQSKAYKNSIKYLEKSLKNRSSNPMIYNNLGIAFKEIHELEKAMENFNAALKIKNDFVQAYNNQGIVLRKLKNFDKSLKYLQKAIRLNPRYFEAYNNIGNTFKDLGNKSEALNNYKKAIELNPKYLDAYLNAGMTYEDLKQYNDAKKKYLEILKINPKFDFTIGKLLHSKMNLCDWKNYDEYTKAIDKSVKEKIITDPFIILSISDDQLIQKKNSENYVDKIYVCKKFNILKNINNLPKIAYFSPDFSNHPVLYLMKNTFENHNRKEFDFYAFSFGLKNKDESHYKIKKYFKKFIYIDGMSDKEVAKICKNLGIDIAIDLCGHTAENRMGLFAERVANHQINYLGYAGTSGAKFMDYILADKYLIPETEKKNYTEKVLYLPNCYQSNPSKDRISKKNYKKDDFNLPNNKFIYCSFNNHNKITPIIFKSWMRILQNVNDSVIWLNVTNDIAKKNILLEAKECGVASNRIIFSSFISGHDEHLKRMKLADLFLDTFPYNAHTTGRDAFRVGLPIITLSGNTFASRVLSSILNSNNLRELITNDLKNYENLAVELGKNKEKYSKLRIKFEERSKNSELFDNVRFTKNLEGVYKNLLKN